MWASKNKGFSAVVNTMSIENERRILRQNVRNVMKKDMQVEGHAKGTKVPAKDKRPGLFRRGITTHTPSYV